MVDQVIARTTIATLAAFLGGACAVLAGRIAPNKLATFIYAAAGALLAIICCDLLPDIKAMVSWPVLLASLCSGAVVFALLSKFVGPICPSCSISVHDKVGEGFGRTASLLMIMLALHSTTDGLALAIGKNLSSHTSFALLSAISFHKLPEGLALAIFLMGTGMRRRYAFLATCLVESTTLVGGWLGVYGLSSLSTSAVGIVMGHVAGGLIFLVLGAFQNLLSHGAHGSKRTAYGMIYASGGTFLATSAALQILSRFAG